MSIFPTQCVVEGGLDMGAVQVCVNAVGVQVGRPRICEKKKSQGWEHGLERGDNLDYDGVK